MKGFISIEFFEMVETKFGLETLETLETLERLIGGANPSSGGSDL
jgi:hypothetical protein